MITLYHMDLPQALQDLGGWSSTEIADIFESYARFCFKTFGDRVKLWITLNEPYVCAKLGHEDGTFAPGIKDPGISVYLAGHNMLRAHAKAWHTYNTHFRPLQAGQVSLALNSDWAEPLHPGCPKDAAATERYKDFTLGWFACPVFCTGDYPESMRARIQSRSLDLGCKHGSRLPRFSKHEPSPLGTADFFALNYYTARKVKDLNGGCKKSELSFVGDQGAEGVVDPSWPICGVHWLAVVPDGLRKLLKYIKVFAFISTSFYTFYLVGFIFIIQRDILASKQNHINVLVSLGHVHQSAHLYHRKRLLPDGAGWDWRCRPFPVLSGHSAGSWQRYCHINTAQCAIKYSANVILYSCEKVCFLTILNVNL